MASEFRGHVLLGVQWVMSRAVIIIWDNNKLDFKCYFILQRNISYPTSIHRQPYSNNWEDYKHDMWQSPWWRCYLDIILIKGLMSNRHQIGRSRSFLPAGLVTNVSLGWWGEWSDPSGASLGPALGAQTTQYWPLIGQQHNTGLLLVKSGHMTLWWPTYFVFKRAQNILRTISLDLSLLYITSLNKQASTVIRRLKEKKVITGFMEFIFVCMECIKAST